MKISKFEEFNVASLCNVNQLIDIVNKILDPVDLESCKTYICQDEKRMGQLLYAPIELNSKLREQFITNGWSEQYKCPKIKGSRQDIDSFCKLSLSDKRKSKVKKTSSVVDFCKDIQIDGKTVKVVLEAQFGKYSFMTSDNLFKFPLFYKNGYSDVGISLCPLKKIVKDMSSGIGDYEKSIIEVAYAPPSCPLLVVGVE